MGLIRYLGSLIKNDTGNSSKSFALVMSTLVSFITSLVICGILIYDVYENGFIKTDLEALGIFIICVYSGNAASGVPKIFGDKYFSKVKLMKKREEEEGIIEDE